ncbi:MAG: OmpA family protein [Rhizobiales bacterium]|nr:OmpA family protein [Hyphomicrobiales bacterium]
MAGKPEDGVHEIIIVKRRGGGHDDGHHGGVWKIAFADFMTAMMAFFLVLWIVNSTSKETRSSIARYFNPIRLAETTPARKGLRDPKESEFDASADDRGRAAPNGPEKSGQSDTQSAKSKARPDDARPARDETDAAKGGEAPTKDERAASPAGKAEAPSGEAKGESKPKGADDAKDAHARDEKDAKDAHAKSPPKDQPKEHARESKDAKDKQAAAKAVRKPDAPAEASGPTRLRPPADSGAGRGGPREGDGAVGRKPSYDEAAIGADPQAVLAALAKLDAPPAPLAPATFQDPFEATAPTLTSRPQGGARSPVERGSSGAGPDAAQERVGAALAPWRDDDGGPGDRPRGDAAPGAAPAGERHPGEAREAKAPPREGRPGDAAQREARQDAQQEARRREAAQADVRAPGDKPVDDKGADARAAQMKADLRGAMAEVFGAASGPSLDVARTPEGVLVSLTDSESFEMFAVGSSEPHPKVIRLMERVSKALARAPGVVVLRGHTDARPFRRGVSDNWRLSAARAHMAQQMLLRGGFDASRVERLEGLADRALRNRADPLAAENRRVEILIRAKE